MSTEVRVPTLPESVSDATVLAWHKKPGESIARDENLVDLETDKVVLEVPSPVAGVLRETLVDTGAVVTADQLLAVVEAGATAPGPATEPPTTPEKTMETPQAAAAPAPAPAATAACTRPMSSPGWTSKRPARRSTTRMPCRRSGAIARNPGQTWTPPCPPSPATPAALSSACP
jgi:pyruvate/2-oxoglutarate dehydrogenase complex dihydrolipoamide acyltransferase (E2) component